MRLFWQQKKQKKRFRKHQRLRRRVSGTGCGRRYRNTDLLVDGNAGCRADRRTNGYLRRANGRTDGNAGRRADRNAGGGTNGNTDTGCGQRRKYRGYTNGSADTGCGTDRNAGSNSDDSTGREYRLRYSENPENPETPAEDPTVTPAPDDTAKDDPAADDTNQDDTNQDNQNGTGNDASSDQWKQDENLDDLVKDEIQKENETVKISMKFPIHPVRTAQKTAI